MKVTVKRGTIVINTINIVLDGTRFRALECDLRSKYPGPILIGSSAHRVTLTLLECRSGDGEDRVQTLNLDPDQSEPTEIIFEDENIGDWVFLVDGVRYSIYIVMHLRDSFTTEVWSSGLN